MRCPACIASGLLLLPLLWTVAATSNQQRSLHGTGLSDAACDPITLDRLTPFTTRAPVVDLQWLDKNDLNVLAITKKSGVDAGGLWLSSDGGKRWAEKTQLLNASLPAREPVDVMTVLSQASNPANVVLLGTGSYIWTSQDYGSSWKAVQTPTRWRGVSSYKMHPRQDSWMLALVKRPSCRSLDHALSDCPKDLMLTKDLFSGQPSWQNLTADSNGRIAGFVDFDWGATLCGPKGCGVDVAELPDELVLATMYDTPGAYDQPWDPDVHFVTSSDWFKTYQTHVRCGNMFEVLGSTIYLAVSNACPVDMDGRTKSSSSAFPQGITLYTSQDAGCLFLQACLPVAVKQEGYELLETHDGTGALVIVNFLINNGVFDIPAASVYSAGPHHALFSLSLTDVYHQSGGVSTDFSKVDSLPGVYIANQMLARPDDESYDVGADYLDLSDLTGTPLVETIITFNGGGRWQRIPAPAAFNNPKCNRCEGSAACFLHLHGMSSWDTMGDSLPAVYSNPSAPGFIMASGNVGIKGVGLDDNDGLCTWLSTDGGVSWRDVAVGAYIYEYADWGGLIIMARHPGSSNKPAEEVLFSTDYGRCWQGVPLAEALLVDNIRVEPDGQRPRVVVHGRRCRRAQHNLCGYTDEDSRSSPEGLMYLVDVQELLGTRIGLCASSDREQWGVPSDTSAATVRCILGRQSRIERRRPGSICFNGPDYKRPLPQNTTCPCSAELDSECDYGFLKMGGTCLAIPAENMPHCPAIALEHYRVAASGQRQVHADTCDNIQAVIPDLDTQWRGPQPGDSCLGTGTGYSGGRPRHSALFGFLIFLLVVLLLAAMFVAWWLYLATEPQRDTVRDLAAGSVAAVSSAVAWVQEKIRGRRAGSDADLHYFQPLGDLGDGLDEDVDARRSLFTLK
ncbi:hypothetical protein V8C86DRAFT_2572580 [Haematococcus lacustris]